jgi:hypothetical protein
MFPNKINSDSTFDSSTPAISEEFKEPSLRGNLSKFEGDLYKEEDDKVEKVLRIKRVAVPNKGVKWKFFEDSKVVFTLEGSKLTNKEKDFLHTVEGVNFLLAQFKTGIGSFSFLKKEIKKKIK